MKEREQKRLYYSPTGDANGSVYAWEYYLLGGMNEQLAVYQGVQMKDNSFRAWNSCTTYSTQNKPEQNQESFVYLYPVEYNIYGLGSSPLLSYRRMGMTGQWKKHLNIPDYIGNVRMVLREGVTPDTWTILDSYNYTAYGKSIFDDESLTPIEHSKHKFIGKQTDEESLLADHGVRKYDYDLGRFTCPDPLWEKYYSWTPYQYAGCNPVSMYDGNGEEVSVYSEQIPLNTLIKGSGYINGTIAYLSGEARHSFVVVTTEKESTLIELGGPINGSQIGNPVIKSVKNNTDYGVRENVEEHIVNESKGQKSKYEFEEKVIENAKNTIKNLPKYDPMNGPNSNGFVKFLIEISGGTVALDTYKAEATSGYTVTPPLAPTSEPNNNNITP
jgi:RHS repeat-associated protein